MARSNAENQRNYRRRNGIGPLVLEGCPSYAAFSRHKRRRLAGLAWECLDPDGCKAAYNAHQRKMYAQRKNNA